MDLYRFGGDSLQGRYHYLRLHPFSVAELRIKKQTEFDSKREVDFVVTESSKPILFVEAKLLSGPPDKGLLYLCQKFPGVQALQISASGTVDDVGDHGIRVYPALTFLATLV